MVPIFDRKLLRKRCQRARPADNFLRAAMDERLEERRRELNRVAAVMLHISPHGWEVRHEGRAWPLEADEEWLPFGPATLDLMMISGCLHWVNDLPGVLAQVHRALKPGGALLAMFPGNETLHELRESLLQAEAAGGGASPHVSPFIDVRDAGALLQRAKFNRPVADVERLSASYADLPALLHDLRAMGEANALLARPRILSRGVLRRAAEHYRAHYSADGRITATFDLVGMTGFK
jgi:SAM-dependent methyltransferase